MNKEEIEQEIKITKDTEKMFGKIFKEKLDDLQAQLIEAEKPKLSSGDVIEWVGENCSNKGVNVILGEDPAKLSQYNLTDNSRGVTDDFPPDKFHRHFNILEQVVDLKALQEPLEEFEIKCHINNEDILRAEICTGCSGQCVWIQVSKSKSVHLHPDKLSELILNLRRMEIKMLLDAVKGEIG